MKEETSMFDIAVAERPGPGLIERIGPPRPLFRDFVGLMLLAIGEGPEFGYIPPCQRER
jgi:hypothetical protein